ncbi:MAG: DUF3552 domain-containing protein, partial [Candidatus Cloacimonetes bacterium]|nr:DUF3552 domain-containing protein [Candidatus Cloacimonadota bacterium]
MHYIDLIYIGIAFLIGFFISLIINFVRKSSADKRILSSNEFAKKIIDDAKHETENLKKTAILEAKEEWYKVQKEYEDEISTRKREIYTLEKEYNERVTKLDNRLENLDKKEEKLQEFEKENKVKEIEIASKKEELDELIEQQNTKLSEIARLSRDEAIQILKNNLKNKARNEAAIEIRRIAENTKAEADQLVAGILSTAIQRVAVDYVSESTVSVVSLPDDEMKGRIIGREGRNIRAFEQASGIDLIIDDTPEAVVLSGFDPVRREIARLSLEKLIQDGRIHPGRIEQVIEKIAKEMDSNLVKIGEKACMETNIHNISP